MSDPLLRLPEPKPVSRSDEPVVPVGRQLVNAGVISQSTLLDALHLQHHLDAPLGKILAADGHVQRPDIMAALATQYDAEYIDLASNLPAMSMAAALPASMCQRFGLVPWRWLGDTLIVATTRPDNLKTLEQELSGAAPRILPAIADGDQINTQIGRLYGAELAQRAITKLPAEVSCRSWSPLRSLGVVGATVIVALLAFSVLIVPTWVATVLVGWGLLTLAMVTILKAAAFASQLSRGLSTQSAPYRPVPPERLPRVSVLVPLFREENITQALIARLSKLTYPKALLDVILVLEAKDNVTRDTVARTELPCWMRVIEVPDDKTITTKPRALNYALDFCDSSIIGVWDAEDAPEQDQIEKVVSRFIQAPANVACLQGILDYYNARQNWLARCFTIEYASWWRMILPGVSRLRLVLPLGGTTLFFRREILEELGGWDAHNVTEDADLGMRLARRGYVTELLPTVTLEEATCHPWPWIKQRSRWLKGFLITYCVHMRRPVALLRDFGWLRFLGFQAMFLATVSQFAALPLLWSFWLPVLGWSHPVVSTMGADIILPVTLFFVASEMLNIAIGLLAVSGRQHRHLIPWVFTLPFYFPLGALASYKALYELATDPFYWEKTRHGTTKSQA